jgi:beta-phosphoglucomutase-like phosphatase (HAD superfamily)
MCRYEAQERSVHVAEIKALWSTRRKGAGPQRNAAMLALEPDEVIAFHEDIAASRGTADMVRRARKAGIKVRVVSR